MNALQKNRGLQITTTAGDDTLLLSRMVAREHLGRPFEINVELLSENHNVDLESLLGSVATIEYTLPSGQTRYFNGRFSQITWAGSKEHFAKYEATLAPWLWFLTRAADCRIFQGKTVPEIIKEVFRDHGFTDFADHLSGEYKKSEYVVQYRESDFDFVSRLMEQEGIYYYFTHQKNKHQLHLCDAVSAHSSRSDYDKLRFYPPDPRRLQEFEFIHQWGVSLEVQSGAYVLNDFDFERPTADLLATSKLERQHDLAKFEVFDYPGDYSVSAHGTTYSQRRIEEQQAKFERVRGTTNAFGLECGALFKLENHQRSDQNCEHLVVSTRIEMTNSEYETGEVGSPMEFNCDFTAMKSSIVFRSPRTTPLPRIRGPQTAIVVGKKNEEIWTDKYGRVKVHFHWDRQDKKDENSSCWVRVAQSWAGKGWGTIHIPRIGQEVIVEFLEGDPNHPIITGRVYNADEMPPYNLPDNGTQSGIKTRSTSKGTNENYNELRFEDKKGAEQIYFHAERDFERIVENNDTLKVGFRDDGGENNEGNQDVEIFNNQTIVVGNKKSDEGSQSITIHKDFEQTVKEGNAAITIEKGDRTTLIKQGDDTLDIKHGAQTTKAGKSILLKVGNNSIKIDQQQIAIKATKISIQADTQIEIKGAMVTAEAQGVMTVKGGVVKLN